MIQEPGPSFDAVLFDLDGTLAYTREDVWDSVDYAAVSIGATLPAPFRADPRNLSLSDREIFEALDRRGDEGDFPVFQKALKTHYRELTLFPKTVLYDGIEDILERLIKASIPAYIVTAKSHQATAKLLSTKGWSRFFRRWASADQFGGGADTKTHVLRTMLERYVEGDRPVYVGDSAGDIIAARNNRIPAIGVLYGDGDRELLLRERPDFIAATADQLASLLFPG